MRVVVGSYFFRYPLGGMQSWALQYLLGLKHNGFEVCIVEKANYPNACYNPRQRITSDDCSYGIESGLELLSRFGLSQYWCLVDNAGNYHGMSKNKLMDFISTCDLYVDMGAHGSWNEEVQSCKMKVLIEGEPGFTQIKWANRKANGVATPAYDRYFSNGRNIGVNGNPAPTLGLHWEHIYSPVDTTFFEMLPPSSGPYSTIMNWKSHAPIIYEGKTFGQKDIEFRKFMELPLHVNAKMEVGISGSDVPEELLKKNKWNIVDAQAVTESFDSFHQYIGACRGEFSVAKNIFIENKTGWFSDRSAAYLACGRPVVLQDTGFSEYFPVGKGLFAVENLNAAIDSIEMIESDYTSQSETAREIAVEYLDAKKVMGKFIHQLGL